MVNDLLFELGTEELPSGVVWPLVDALANNFITLLAKASIQHGEVHRFASPRRLAILIYDVQEEQPAQKISRRGPAVASSVDAAGKPLPPLLGFAKSCDVSIDKLTKIATEKGEWWAYEAQTPLEKTTNLLPRMITEALDGLPIPKPMRWGDGAAQFARPVHWAVLLFGDDVVPCQVLGVNTGRYSVGHRFHHPKSIEISTPRIYESLLSDAFVAANFATRRQMIVEQVNALASQHGYQAIMPDELLDEVTSIVEWPEALLANFEPEFLEVPPEVLIAAMQSHQKCFALNDKKGNLVPHFITVANIVSLDRERVIAGNEKVMRARLSDAAFFYRQDKKQKLSAYYDRTAQVVFQAKLGSLQDKTSRIKQLMDYLAKPLHLELKNAARAAELSKCDLMTGMVGEFPELQGLMGYYYARHDGESEAVAEALNEQYMPRFSKDELPQSPLGLALSLADRLDTMVGIFAIGQKPSGVKDPFKLRRHALAIARLLVTTPADLSLSALIDQALKAYGSVLTKHDDIAELKPFILERLQSYYQAQDIPAEIVQAVRARQDDRFYDMDKRVKALLTFIALPEALSLSGACKRVSNLLQQVSLAELSQVEMGLLAEPAEKALFEGLQTIEKIVTPLYSAGDYSAILTQLASLNEKVNAFFDHVMIMVEDKALKTNRLSLLARLQKLLQGVADISCLTSIR
jgi:glycyl-tRNA synthetase beta chain